MVAFEVWKAVKGCRRQEKHDERITRWHGTADDFTREGDAEASCHDAEGDLGVIATHRPVR